MKMNYLKIPWQDIRGTTVISLLIHLFLLLIFLIFQVSTKIDLPEFVEISFAKGNTLKSVSRPKPVETKPNVQPQRQTAPAAQEETTLNEKIQLPKRRMMEEEPPALNVRKNGKKITTDRSPGKLPQKQEQVTGRDQFIPETKEGQKETIQPGQLSQPGKLIPDAGKPGLDQSFEIEGQAAERKILTKVLPIYPKGYGKEGTIKIKFTILPGGMVGEMIPVLKTDAVLEQNAMEALKKWRFNPVPPTASQEPVQGIITFRYKLK